MTEAEEDLRLQRAGGWCKPAVSPLSSTSPAAGESRGVAALPCRQVAGSSGNLENAEIFRPMV